VKDATEYLAHIKALIVLNPQVVHWTAEREEEQGDTGLFRYKLVLRDGGRIELFELFRVAQESVRVTKYSFHWQGPGGELRARWDNAPHHPQVPTHPCHVHDGSEANVLAHAPITVEEVLGIIAAEAVSETGPDSGT
jgi:hypothetical protein